MTEVHLLTLSDKLARHHIVFVNVAVLNLGIGVAYRFYHTEIHMLAVGTSALHYAGRSRCGDIVFLHMHSRIFLRHIKACCRCLKAFGAYVVSRLYRKTRSAVLSDIILGKIFNCS